MNDILFNVLLVVVMVLSILLTTYVIPFLKAKIKNSEYDALLDTVFRAVRAAEQKITESGMGQVKKAQVIAYVKNWLEARKITITEEQLDTLIEAAVFIMNKED